MFNDNIPYGYNEDGEYEMGAPRTESELENDNLEDLAEANKQDKQDNAIKEAMEMLSN